MSYLEIRAVFVYSAFFAMKTAKTMPGSFDANNYRGMSLLWCTQCNETLFTTI